MLIVKFVLIEFSEYSVVARFSRFIRPFSVCVKIYLYILKDAQHLLPLAVFLESVSECLVCAHDKREMFYFIFHFLLCCCLNPPTTNAGARGAALKLPRTHAHTDAHTRH